MIYIIGDIFDADHNIGSEIMEISKVNYRMKEHKIFEGKDHFIVGSGNWQEVATYVYNWIN